MAEKAYLAIDMGASSGRHVVGRFDGRRLRLEEVYRFDNGPVDIGGRLYWDLPGLWSRVRQGLAAAGAAVQPAGRLVSVGVDTWGVDFGLLGRNDELLGNPYHYRDSRTNGMMEKAFAIVPREEIFRHTRPAVHAVQHAVPTAGDEAGRLAAAGRGRDDAAGARPVPLAADRA